MKSSSNIFKSENPFNIPVELLQEKPYVATTNLIEVSVWPEFIDKKISVLGDIYIWAYHVRIANNSPDEIQLLSRYWRIIDEHGNIQEVEGEGVVGEKPKILPSSSYQYSSGVHLKLPSGIMTGKYCMKKINQNEIFDIKIPNFSLDIPSDDRILN
jgi:ApaG protein